YSQVYEVTATATVEIVNSNNVGVYDCPRIVRFVCVFWLLALGGMMVDWLYRVEIKRFRLYIEL
ncbi:MAG: hypothetical protein L7S59_00390, partial [Pseudomonadales bacterium]|nr:hypothetical protein [Pseudomonadales bacterium]